MSLASITGAELHALLQPVTPERFVAEYFAKRPLHVKGDPAATRAEWFGLERFEQALRRIERTGPPGVSVDAHRRVEPPHDHLQPIEAGHWRDLYSDGATICITNAHLADDTLYALTRALKLQLAFTGRVRINAYLSPPGEGLRTHFDMSHATVVQTHGSKVWRYGRQPAVSAPRRAARLGADGEVMLSDGDRWPLEPWEHVTAPTDADLALETTLNPGDVLCLPAGTWHAACATDVASLALNVNFLPTGFDQLVCRLIRSGPGMAERWREGLPAIAGGPQPDPTPELRDYLQQRLKELGQWLAGMAPDAPDLMELVYGATTAGRFAVAGGPSPAQRLRTRADRPVCYHHRRDRDELVLYCGNMQVTLPAAAKPLVRRVVAREAFDRGAMLDGLTTAGPAQAWLATLEEAGVLEPAPEDS